MKARLFLLAILPVLLFSCYACPGNWSDSPQTFTFTLDKYEAKTGDEITVDSGDVKIFDSKEVTLEYHDWDNNDELYSFKYVKKLSSSEAIFEVPTGSFSGKLKIQGNIKQKEDGSCGEKIEFWYCDGESDKPLTIVTD